jgi:hypothetical protein
MIINPYLVQPSGPSYGTLTTAWIAATGETDLTILGALNTLETDLTTYGLTAKMKALYPFVGGTAGKHSYNFMNTAAYQITWNGGVTHSSSGVQGNGTNGYGNLNFNMSTQITSVDRWAAGFYANSASAGGGIDFGADYLTNWYLSAKTGTLGTNVGRFQTNASQDFTDTTGTGFYCGVRESATNVKVYKNSSQLLSNTTGNAGAFENLNVIIGGLNRNNTFFLFRSTRYGLAFIYDESLSGTQESNFYTAVQRFQTTLGRQVGVPIVSDSDAQAFLNAAVITDTTQATAVNNLVIGLKADSLWTKMAAIYPMVGGTATAHSYNLKNTAANQITWSGGITHSSTGVLFNGTNGFGDSNFNVNTYKDNNHLSYYIRTNLDEVRVDAGLIGSIGQYFDVESRISNVGYFGNHIAATNVNFAVTDSRGLWLNTRTTSTLQKVYKNGTSQGSNTSSGTTAINGNVYFGARNVVGTGANLYSTKETAFASIGDGLTDTDAANLYTRVQTYQTALSRNV